MQNTRNKELVSSYLKMHTTLSNAFKETEAVNGMYVKKMDEVTFKEKFESHLKKLATCEDYDICLTDGSKFNYGTYNEGCPTGTCMELTIDTNGNRMPNKSGKDIFTMLVTDRGIKALGESNMCETGLDCGAYILANHKLYDGTVDEVAPPVKEPTAEELAQQAFEQCKASGEQICTNANGEEVRKLQGEYLTKAERKELLETSTKDFYDMINDALARSEAVNGDAKTWSTAGCDYSNNQHSEQCIGPIFEKYWKDYLDYESVEYTEKGAIVSLTNGTAFNINYLGKSFTFYADPNSGKNVVGKNSFNFGFYPGGISGNAELTEYYAGNGVLPAITSSGKEDLSVSMMQNGWKIPDDYQGDY